MKHALLTGMCLLLLWGEGWDLSAKNRNDRKEKAAKQVEQQISAQHFYMDVTLVQPVGLATFTPSRGQYFVSVRKDRISLYLPYVGRGYNVPYGGGSALRFTSPLESYQVKPGKKGSSTIMMSARNENDRMVYMTLTVYPNGSAYLRVRVDGLQMIGYSGELKLSASLED